MMTKKLFRCLEIAVSGEPGSLKLLSLKHLVTVAKLPHPVYGFEKGGHPIFQKIPKIPLIGGLARRIEGGHWRQRRAGTSARGW